MKRTVPATTLGAPGATSSRPTVATRSLASALAMASTAKTICAAPASASRRKPIALVPAWPATPRTTA